ncbi:MAG: hypothetical protein A2W80_02010 [Candidatus Riflebacteria bacterium GWC2_50_8]|nr:MAG: hypothetical protein A2W80_02010 [Candidatus Riflebacteria bacterium GWC2_50_8]
MKKLTLILLTVVFSALSLAVMANGNLSCSTAWSKSVPVHLVERKVTASSQNGIVLLEIEDIFFNPTYSRCEGVYKFKMPPGAFAAGFWINTDEKEWVKGEIRKIAEARKIYQTITSRLTDPGILEQKDDEITVRVFPIESKKKVGIRFRYFFAAHGEKDRLVFNFPVGFSTAVATDDFESRRAEPETARLNFVATFYDADSISDAVASNDKARINADGKQCNLSLSAEGTLLEDFSVSYRTGSNEKVSVMSCKAADGSRYSLIRARNLEYAKSDEECRIGVIVDASGSMSYRNKERALRAVSTISAMPRVKTELFVAADGDLRRVEPGELEKMKFYGATTWNGLASFPADGDYAGIVLITDGDNLRSSHLQMLWSKVKRRPVQIVYLHPDYSRALAVMAENYGGCIFYGKATADDQLAAALARSVEMLRNNPFLFLPGERRVMPLFGSLSEAAYYVLAFKAGSYNLKTATGKGLLSFDIGDNMDPQEVLPWFGGIAGRQVIKQLEANERTPEVIEKITELGLRYGQTTDYTAFLAVPDEIAQQHSDAMNPAYLAMFAAPNFRKARQQSREKACFANMRVLMGALEMYCMDIDFKDPETGKDMSSSLGKLEHDLYTGLFKIEKLVEMKYLKSMLVPAENDCDYRIIGNFMKEGYVVCMVHGSIEQSGVSIEDMIKSYCSAHNLDFDDFDFPYEKYGSYPWAQSLEWKLQQQILIRLFLAFML